MKDAGSALVAYSGGVDSTFLLKAAADALGVSVVAVTADSPTYPQSELAFARRMTAKLDVRHVVIRTNELESPYFYRNPVTRCYYCKKKLFRHLKALAGKYKMKLIADASTVSDKKDFRPGSRAKAEFGVRSPLAEAGLTKEEIRAASRKMRLETWDKPSLACLASRIPYGMRITVPSLERIGRAEEFLRRLGFRQVRARNYGDLCRLEVDPRQFRLLVSQRIAITGKLKTLGYRYITADLEGFRSGSMNPVRL